MNEIHDFGCQYACDAFNTGIYMENAGTYYIEFFYAGTHRIITTETEALEYLYLPVQHFPLNETVIFTIRDSQDNYYSFEDKSRFRIRTVITAN